MVCYVNGPETNARSNIENPGGRGDWSEEEFVVEGEEPKMVSANVLDSSMWYKEVKTDTMAS